MIVHTLTKFPPTSEAIMGLLTDSVWDIKAPMIWVMAKVIVMLQVVETAIRVILVYNKITN